MADQTQEKPAFRFNLGDRVKIHHSRGMHGRVVELRVLLGQAVSRSTASWLGASRYADTSN